MLCTNMALQTWSGLVFLATVGTGVLEVEMRLHVSLQHGLVFVFLSTMIALPQCASTTAR